MKTIAVFLSILIYGACTAQMVITLTPRDEAPGRQQIIISEGNRLKCKLINGKKVVGIIKEITNDSINIEGRKVAIDEIRLIAKRSKGVTGLVIGLNMIPAAMSIIGLEAELLPLALSGVALQLISSNLLASRAYQVPMRNIKDNWILEVHIKNRYNEK